MSGFLKVYLNGIVSFADNCPKQIKDVGMQIADIHTLRSWQSGFECAVVKLDKWHDKVFEEQPNYITGEDIKKAYVIHVRLMKYLSKIRQELERRGEVTINLGV